MAKLLDFEDQEKGYKPLSLSREEIKKHIGKIMCYVDFVEPYRGTYFVRYGKIHSIKSGRILLNNGDDYVFLKNIKEAGIKID